MRQNKRHGGRTRGARIAMGILSAVVCGGWHGSPTRAGDQTWTLGANGSWNTLDLNWSGGAWVNNDNAIFPSGTAYSVTVTQANIGFDDLIFNSGYTIASGAGNLILSSDLSSTITTASSVTATISEDIGDNSAASSLVKDGAGTLTLGGINSYTGGTSVNAGTLSFTTGGSLGPGNLTMNGGALVYSGTSGDATTTSNLVVDTAGFLDVTGNKNWTLNGNISGAGSITRGTTATQSLYLGGDNSGYTGQFTVQSSGNAVVRFTAATAGSENAKWVVNQATNARCTLDFNSGTIKLGSLTGTGYLTAQGVAGTKTIQVGNLGLNETFAGTLNTNGTGVVMAVEKVGNGIWTLSGASSYTGGTTINAGTVAISADNNLGASASGVMLNGGALRVNIPTQTSAFTNTHVISVGASGGTIGIPMPTSGTPTWILGNAGNLTGSGALTLTGTGVLGQAGTSSVMVINSANSGYTGAVTIQNGAILEYANSSALSNASSITVGNLGEYSIANVATSKPITINSGGYLAFQNGNGGNQSGGVTLNGNATVRMQDWWGTTVRNGTISGPISGPGGLTVTNGSAGGTGGELILSGNNSYLGGTTLTSGRVRVNHASGLGSGGIVAAGNAGVYVGTNVTTSGAVTGTGTLDNSIAGAGASWSIDGDVSGFQGTFRYLSGTNSQNNVNIGGSTDASMDMSQATISLSGATSGGARALRVRGSGPSATFKIGDLNGAGQLNVDNGLTVEVGALNQNTSFSGTIQQFNGGSTTSGVRKVGTGTWTLTGTHNYTGSTTIASGTLSLSGAFSNNIASSSNIIVGRNSAESSARLSVTSLSASSGTLVLGSSQKLSGHGMVIGGVTVSSGSTLAPGNSAGTLSISGPVAIAGGSLATMEFEFIGTEATPVQSADGGVKFDVLNVTGNLNLGGGRLNIVVPGGLASVLYYTPYTIVTTSSGTISGSFSKLNDQVASSQYRGSYPHYNVTVSGTSIQITFVPEPSSLLLLAAGGCTAILQSRRMRAASPRGRR